LRFGRAAFIPPVFRAVRALARREAGFFRFGAAFLFDEAFLPPCAFRAAFFAIVGLLPPA
jgi:hypothetical protein